MYRAHGVNFYLSSGSAPFLSMEKVIERGLLTWEENRPHPRLMVISMFNLKIWHPLRKYLANLGTHHLLFTLCRPWQSSIKQELGRFSYIAWVRLRQIVTGSKKFQVGFLDYNYKQIINLIFPDISIHRQRILNIHLPLPARSSRWPARVTCRSLPSLSTSRKKGMEIWLGHLGFENSSSPVDWWIWRAKLVSSSVKTHCIQPWS